MRVECCIQRYDCSAIVARELVVIGAGLHPANALIDRGGELQCNHKCPKFAS